MDNPASRVSKGLDANRLLLGAPYVAALALIGVLYSHTFVSWYYEWTAAGSFYAHSMFVPFFVGVMLWRNRERLGRVAWQPSWSGLFLLVPGLLILLISLRGDVPTMQSLSFILLLLGGSLLLLGVGKTRKLLFPLLFVMMMMPLIPDQLINGIAFPIQMKSAQLAVWILNHITLTSFQEGTQIHMEHYRMAVEVPCSGFKTLLSLLTFSAAFAYLVEAPVWKRWLLFGITAPLSLVINGLRIALIGVVGELISTNTAKMFHDYSGFIVLILAFAFLFNFARLIKCERFLGVPLTDEIEKRDALAAKAAREADPDGQAREPEWWQIVLRWRPSVRQMRRALPFALVMDLAFALSLVTLIGLNHATPAPKLPIATFQVPRVFTYNGVTYTCEDSPYFETDTLPPAEFEMLTPLRVINRNYVGSDGSHIQYFMTAGNGRKVFHDPHNCALGSDAMIQDLDVIPLKTPRETINVQEAHWKRTGIPDEQEMMFCYVVQGKVLQSTKQIRNALIWQTFFGDGGQPSYFVRVFQATPGVEPAKKQQLENFIAGLWQSIGPVLHGDVAGQVEAPPRPSRPMSERH